MCHILHNLCLSTADVLEEEEEEEQHEDDDEDQGNVADDAHELSGNDLRTRFAAHSLPLERCPHVAGSMNTTSGRKAEGTPRECCEMKGFELLNHYYIN